MHKTRIIGHRGARGEAPENTLGGFRHLATQGFRAVEFDIQVAADGTLVVLHDDHLDRTTNARGPLSDYTQADLAQVNAAAQAQPAWPHVEPVPTLEAVLALLQDFEHIELEVKRARPAALARVIEALPTLWRRFDLAGRARVTSFHRPFLVALQAQHPELERGLLIEEGTPDDGIEAALALNCRQIGPHHRLLTPDLMRAAQAAGLEVSTWTVNEAARARQLQSWGVTGIITDIPTQLATALN